MLAGFPHSLLTSTGPSKDRFPPAPTYGFGWGWFGASPDQRGVLGEGRLWVDERTRSRGMGARVAVGAFFDEVMRGSA